DPLNRASLEAEAEIEIDPHGGLLDVRVTGSGNDDFDAAVTEVVRDREPFPKPPPGLLSDDGHFHLRWRFARDIRQAGVAGAELDKIGGADKVRPIVAEWLRGAAGGDPNALTASLTALGAVPADDLLATVTKQVAGGDARVRATACPVYGRTAVAGTTAAW